MVKREIAATFSVSEADPFTGDAVTYDITTDGNVNGYISPRLAFGHGSSYGWLPWVFGGLFAMGLLELFAALGAWLGTHVLLALPSEPFVLVLALVILLYVAGLIDANMFGHAMLQKARRIALAIPGVRVIYAIGTQVTTTAQAMAIPRASAALAGSRRSVRAVTVPTVGARDVVRRVPAASPPR